MQSHGGPGHTVTKDLRFGAIFSSVAPEKSFHAEAIPSIADFKSDGLYSKAASAVKGASVSVDNRP